MRFFLRLGLQVKLLLLTLLVVLLFVGIFAALVRHSEDEIIAIVLDERLHIASTLAASLDSFVHEAGHALEKIAASPELNLTDNNLDPERALLRQAYGQTQFFTEGLVLFDQEGKLLLTEPPEAGTLGDPEHLREVLRGQGGPLRVFVAPLDTRARPVLCFALPVRHGEGPITGVVLGATDLAKVPLTHVASSFSMGATGYLELVDKEGTVLVSSRPERVLKPSDHAGFLAERLRTGKAVTARCHSCHEAGAKRVEEILAFAPAFSAPLGIAIRQSEEEALHLTRHLTRNTYLLGGITIIIALLVSLFFGVTTVRPLRKLTREVERIGKGNLEEAITSPLMEDEIGTLARAAEGMRKALREDQERQAQWQRVLEDTVKEKTQKLQSRVRELEAVNRFNLKLVNERAELIGKLEKRLAQFTQIDLIARELCVAPSLNALLNSIVSRLSEVVNSTYTSVVLVRENGTLITSAETRMVEAPLHERARRDGLTRTVIATGEILYLPHYATDPRSNPLLVSQGIKSWAGISLKAEGKVRGVLIARSQQEDAFADDLEILEAFAHWAEQALLHLNPG